METLAYTGDVRKEKGRERRWKKSISKNSIHGIQQECLERAWNMYV